jgi:hypothetical protein
MPQLDQTVEIGSEPGASVTRKNQPIGQTGAAAISYTATNLLTGAGGSRHVMQIDLSFTYPGTLSFAEIINTVTVDTLPAVGQPPIHTDIITAGNESLNISDQLDFRLTMSYPASSTIPSTYAIRIRIDGNYE